MNEITIKVSNLFDKELIYHQLDKEIEKAKASKQEKLKELLNLSIEMGSLITMTDEQLRGLGKTKAVIEKAVELNVPIIASYKHQADLLRKYGEADVFHISSEESARGYSFTKGFLIDEGTNDTVVKELIKGGSKLLGGFKRL